MRPFLRSLCRILGATAIGVAVLLGALFVVVRQPTLGARESRAALRADPERLRRHVETLTAIPSRDADHPESLERAARYLERELLATGARVRSERFAARGEIYRNVVAEVGPRGGPLHVVGAHYDAFGLFGANPGADDNASGAAGVVELARLLAASPPPHRVELALFTTEEPPYFASAHMGSVVHAAGLARRGEDVAAMLCLEMIGYFTAQQPWPNWLYRLLYPDHGGFVAVVGRWNDRRLARHVKAAFRGASDVPAYSFTAPGPLPGLDASDHRSFWERGATAVMVTDTGFFRNPHYHTPGDVAATLDYARMAAVVDGVAAFALQNR